MSELIRPQAAPIRHATESELLSTLFELGREVTSVLDLADLLEKIPQLIARLTRFSAFSVYLLDEGRQELHVAYAVGYPQDVVRTLRLKVGQGVVGAAVEQGRPILVNDIGKEPRFMGPLRNMVSQLAVPMRRKGTRDWRAQPAQRAPGCVHRPGRNAAAAVRRACGRRHRERAAVRVRAPLHGNARDARGNRPRDVLDPRSRGPAHAHREPDQARRRLPDVRHPAAQRHDATSSR